MRRPSPHRGATATRPLVEAAGLVEAALTAQRRPVATDPSTFQAGLTDVRTATTAAVQGRTRTELANLMYALATIAAAALDDMATATGATDGGLARLRQYTTAGKDSGWR